MKFLYTIMLLFCSLIPILNAQHSCGTHLSEANLEHIKQINKKWQAAPQVNRSGAIMNFVPVQLHIIRATDGSGGISAADYEAALDEVNQYYKNANIHFYQCSSINYIDDDTYYDYDKAQKVDLDAAHSVANVINIYSTDNCTSGGTAICGHAEFPGGLDFVMLANGCTTNGSTFAHELGHYFNLYHTHETFLGAESVDGSDCAVDGDLLCDTPADPNLSGEVDAAGCVYTGLDTDENGDTYLPNVNNVMSYVTRICRYSFTPNQYSRMLYTLQNNRAYLSCGTTPALDAEFYYDYSTSCNTGLTVDFCDLTAANADSWSWNFGDGNTSSSQSPSHTYNTAGTYDVALTATKGANNNTETKNYIVTVGTQSLPYTQDFESGSSAMGDFVENVSMKNTAKVAASGAKDGSMGLVMEGFQSNESPFFATPSAATAFSSSWNFYYKTLLEICIDATNATGLFLDFDLKQLRGFNDNYTNFRVTVDGTQIGSVYQADGTETWQDINIDLSAYDGSVITIGFEASNKYSEDYQTTNGNASYIDNIEINAAALPVELSVFDANWNQQQSWVDLNWKTESEQNNDRFELERMNDDSDWQSVKEIAGNGTSFTPTQYTTIDDKAQPGINYYRLKQIDHNEQFEYSDIVAVDVPVLNKIKRIYPNPAGDYMIIESQEIINNLYLQNSLGQNFRPPVSAINNGYRIDLSNLNTGIYWLQMNEGSPIKVLVQRF